MTDEIERTESTREDAAHARCDEVLIELGLGNDATIIVRKPGSNITPFKRRQAQPERE